MNYNNEHLYHLYQAKAATDQSIQPDLYPLDSSDSQTDSHAIASMPSDSSALDAITQDLTATNPSDPLSRFLDDKRRFLGKSVEDILNLIWERETLKRDNLHQINQDSMKTENRLSALDHWHIKFDPQLERLRGNIEKDLLGLEKERRMEEVACWRDIARLRGELREAMREVAQEKRRDTLIRGGG